MTIIPTPIRTMIPMAIGMVIVTTITMTTIINIRLVLDDSIDPTAVSTFMTRVM